MFDLGRSFLASVERSPDAVAIVDGERRFTYADWSAEICRVADGLAGLRLKRRDRLAVVSQNRIEMATLYWTCQFLAIVMTPLNWRLKAKELNYCLADAEVSAVVFDAVAADAIAGTVTARNLPRIAIGGAEGGSCRFEDWSASHCTLMPQAGDDSIADSPTTSSRAEMCKSNHSDRGRRTVQFDPQTVALAIDHDGKSCPHCPRFPKRRRDSTQPTLGGGFAAGP